MFYRKRDSCNLGWALATSHEFLQFGKRQFVFEKGAARDSLARSAWSRSPKNRSIDFNRTIIRFSDGFCDGFFNGTDHAPAPWRSQATVSGLSSRLSSISLRFAVLCNASVRKTFGIGKVYLWALSPISLPVGIKSKYTLCFYPFRVHLSEMCWCFPPGKTPTHFGQMHTKWIKT